MIDLNYKKPEKKDEELPLIAQFWILAIFSLFLAYIFLSGLTGTMTFWK